MRSEDFDPSMPGTLANSVLGHLTFVPKSLGDLSFRTIDVALANCLIQAERALGELSGLGRMLPNPHLLIRPFLGREAVLSSQIEGTVTQLDQLFLFDVSPDEDSIPNDAGEVQNYVRAIEFGLDQMSLGYPISLKLLLELHRILMTDVRGEDKRPGKLRDRAVLLGKPGQTFEQARYVPPCHTEVQRLLQDLIAYLRKDDGMPIVLRLSLVHYQFEAIHPFNDGNGRLGRLLMPMLLCQHGALSTPLLYLSAYFEKHRQEYYDRLLEVSRKGRWTEWIEFFAMGIAEQALDAANRARRLLDLAASYRKRLSESARSAAAISLIDAILERPFLTIPASKETTNASFKSTSRQIALLVKLGILREITGRKRNRVFVADEVLRLLEEPLD